MQIGVFGRKIRFWGEKSDKSGLSNMENKMKTRTFMQILEVNEWMYSIKEKRMVPCEPYLSPPCGTNAVAFLDGRKSLVRLVEDAERIFKQRRKLHKNYATYTICKGDFYSWKELYQRGVIEHS
jgi:hypothetical protein